MTVSIPKLRRHLNTFDFRTLFIEGLNWHNYREQLPPFTVPGGATYTFTPIAGQAGMAVLEVRGDDGELPTRSVAAKIEKHITALKHEHILIFVNGARDTAQWQWVKHGEGAARARRHTLYKGQLADALLQKLAGIAFSLDELDDEGRALISVVVDKVKKAFDRENVTKKFYNEFARKHDNFRDFLKGIQEKAHQDWYTSLLLNRLMFLYFVQSKRFLNNDPGYLRTHLEAVEARGGNYYRDFLCVLFFEGLAKEEGERDAAHTSLLGKVPYLNGGLFLKHSLEEKYPHIAIANDAFRRLFDFFDDWNWHLDERPLRAGNEINPDVLGYIFEKYINQKQMGAYYTQEDITSYICKNTILPFLLEKTAVSVPDLLPEIEPYIYDAVKQREYLPTETERERNARRARYEQILDDYKAGKIAAINDLITYNLDIESIVQDWLRRLNNPVTLYTFYFNALKPLTVLDPTCGSGAFLFAAMNILEPLYEIALQRMEQFIHPVNHSHFIDELAQVRKHANRRYFIFKSIIIQNLYGVDIMEEAVEICKLRLFLKLVAQVEAFKDIEPLPDIDFNIKAGNTLVGFATEREITGRLFATDELRYRVKSVDRAMSNYRALQTRTDMTVTAAQLRKGKQDIQTQLNVLRDELDHALMQQYGQHDLHAYRNSHKPFNWYAEFHQVLHGDEGFDVIVGNPPYVEYRKVRSEYSLSGYTTEASGNLYAYVMERSFLLLKQSGISGMIVPVSSISGERSQTLQTLLLANLNWVSSFSNRPAKLFDGVEQRLSIMISKRRYSVLPEYYSAGYSHWYVEERDTLLERLRYVRNVREKKAH